MIPKKFQLKNTIKYPTSVIIGGANKLGVEIADSLIKQGGYVVIIDNITNDNVSKFQGFDDKAMLSLLDYTSIPHLEEDIRRLDYVFYFNHESIDFRDEISTGDFLTISNYLDAALSLASKFEARFLLTTSIKANQVLYANDDAAYKMSMSRSYTQTYTNMEMQRYSEGLVMEYNEKAGLNTRIVRLGEIIGDGMDFNHKSVFIDLLISALEEEDLLLKNDGLENEWFVHTLDAAYALIKAQFSKETAGSVFSVCYENTYSHLSIAYKVQELEENAGEIKFIEAESLTPPLRIYKPAPNLSRIGWMPRISFERAVTQSLASAKIHLIEKNVDRIEEAEDIGQLKSFLSLAGNSPSSTKLRLASKQEREEKLRKEKIKLASKEIKRQKNKREKRLPEKMRDLFWAFFKGLAGTFGFLKKMSPVEFGVFIVFFIIFTVLYFILFSPLLFIVRNSITVLSQYEESKIALENSNFDDVNSSIDELQFSLENIRESLLTLRIPADFVSYSDEIDKIDTFIEYYEEYSESLKDISYALMPYNQYLNEFENNTALRKSNEGFLSLSNEGKSYLDLISEISNREIFYEKGIERQSRIINSIRDNTLPSLPGFIIEELRAVNTYLIDLQNLSERTGLYLMLPDLLGNAEPTTYLIFIADNTRPSPVGGDLAAFSLITFQNGGIQSAQVRSIDDLEINPDDLTEELLSRVNVRRFRYIDNEEFKVGDLSTIENFEDFSKFARELLGNNLNTEIDEVAVVNIESFSDYISILNESNLDIVIGGTDFNDGDLLSLINETQIGNDSLESKHNIIAELSALIIHNSFNLWKNNSNTFENYIAQNILTEKIRFNSSDLEINERINSAAGLINLDEQDTFIIPSIYVEDPKVVKNDVYPNATLSLETRISDDLKIKNTLKMTFPNIGSRQEVSVCFPDNIRLSSVIINESIVPIARQRVNIDGNLICASAEIINETEFEVEWEDETFFATENEVINYSIGIGNVNGARTELDHVIVADRSLSITDSEGEPISSEFGSIELVNRDLVKEFVITRN